MKDNNTHYYEFLLNSFSIECFSTEDRRKENPANSISGLINGKKSTRCHKHIIGFTLIELLIVIAIIAILASILFPALSKARNRSKEIICLGNHKQMGVSVLMYSNDNNAWAPSCSCSGGLFWFSYFLSNYLNISDDTSSSRVNTVLWCPAENRKLTDSSALATGDPVNYIRSSASCYSYNFHWGNGEFQSYIFLPKLSTHSKRIVITDGFGREGDFGTSPVVVWNYGTCISPSQYNDFGNYALWDTLCRHDQKFCAAFLDGHSATEKHICAGDQKGTEKFDLWEIYNY